MAPPSNNFPPQYWPKLVLGSSLAVLLWALPGCSQKPIAPLASGSPAAVSATGPGAATPSEGGAVDYAAISQEYQAPLVAADNGWPIIKPLVTSADPSAPSPADRLQELDLAGKPADLAFFDQDILPKLREGFSKPSFGESHPLLWGQDPLTLSYRSLRMLCDLTAQRADLLWKAGKKDEALELLRLPLSVAKASQSRPETVSVNSFSAAYAGASLRTLADWASDNTLTEPQLSQAAKLLAEYRPSYSHLVRSVAVDFAQLDNSLADEPTRTEKLGLAMASPEDVKVWREQIGGLLDDTEALSGLGKSDPQVFNSAVMKAAAPVHGLVLDYPNIITMQKHAYAAYLATELALSLERHRQAGDKKSIDSKQLFDETFGTDEETKKAAEALLEYQPGRMPGSFSLLGRVEPFQLAAPPDGRVTFYER